MVSSKLLLASVAFAVFALALAKHRGPKERGPIGAPGAPNGMKEPPRPDNRPEGRHGKSKERSRSHESHEGSHEEGPCHPADGPVMNMFDNSTREAIAAIWSNYTSGDNCTEQLMAQEAVLKDAFIAILDAKAADLTEAAREVYEQFKAALMAFEALSPEDQGALMNLKSILDPMGGEGHRGGKRGGPRFGPKRGSSEEPAEELVDI